MNGWRDNSLSRGRLPYSNVARTFSYCRPPDTSMSSSSTTPSPLLSLTVSAEQGDYPPVVVTTAGCADIGGTCSSVPSSVSASPLGTSATPVARSSALPSTFFNRGGWVGVNGRWHGKRAVQLVGRCLSPQAKTIVMLSNAPLSREIRYVWCHPGVCEPSVANSLAGLRS